MAATVMGLGADLNVPNVMPMHSYSWPVMLSFDNQQLDGRLSLLTGEDGNLVDSALGVSRLGSAALSGTFKCMSGTDGVCRLQAETATGIATSTLNRQCHRLAARRALAQTPTRPR